MNVERIRQLAAHLREPATAPHFNMDRWLQTDIEGADDRPIGEVVHTCGTVACIAGHAVALFKPKERVRETSIWATAEELLGLTDDQSSDLFLPGIQWADATAEKAASVLDHLANTGEIDWSDTFASLTEGAR